MIPESVTVGTILESVSEGTTINLGNIDVQIMETPGHSSCSITAYVPQLLALFPSDGGGIPYKETVIVQRDPPGRE